MIVAASLLLKKIYLLHRFVLFGILSALGFACTAKRPCTDSHIHPAFIGFSASDIDTLILRAYQPNGNFQQVVDTVMVTDKFASIYTSSHDTTIVYVNDSEPRHWIKPGFDWELYLPATGKLVRITAIAGVQVEGKGRQCYNPVHSFNADGQNIIPAFAETDKFYTSGYRVYVRK